jgi:kumamolisin
MIARSRLSRWVLLYLVATLALLLPLAACGNGGQPVQQPKPTASFSTQPTTFDLGIPDAAMHSPVVGNLPGDTILHVTVTFKMNQALLNRLDTQQVQGKQGVDLQTEANQLGISDQTYQKIKQFLGMQDAQLKLDKLHTSLSVDAKASTFANLLGVKIVYHEYLGRKFFAPDKPLRLPKFMVDNIVAINGLDSFSKAPRPHLFTQSAFAHAGAQLTQRGEADCLVDRRLITPDQIATAYHYDQLYKQGWTGQDVTIILPEFSAYDPADVQNYFSCLNYQGHLIPHNVDNAPTQSTGEETLDIEMAAGLAPKATIEVYQTDFDTDYGTPDQFWQVYHDVLSAIITDNTNNHAPKVVSISWGLAEQEMTRSTVNMLDNDIQMLTRAEHITVFVASGDCGAYDDGEYNQLAVDFPAADPWAIGVGGTQLSVDGKSNRTSEVVWSDDSDQTQCGNKWGSGGGLSTLFTRPAWQNTVGVQSRYSDGSRQMPDLSAVAFDLPNYYQGQWLDARGTSAATPIWATGFALANQGLVAKTHYFVSGPGLFYWSASNSGSLHPFYDIQQGSNLYYLATPQWDFTSGLGTPNINDLYQVFSQYIQRHAK